MENLSKEILNLKNKPLSIIHGKKGIGKSMFVKKIFEKNNYEYFKFEAKSSFFENISR